MRPLCPIPMSDTEFGTPLCAASLIDLVSSVPALTVIHMDCLSANQYQYPLDADGVQNRTPIVLDCVLDDALRVALELDIDVHLELLMPNGRVPEHFNADKGLMQSIPPLRFCTKLAESTLRISIDRNSLPISKAYGWEPFRITALVMGTTLYVTNFFYVGSKGGGTIVPRSSILPLCDLSAERAARVNAAHAALGVSVVQLPVEPYQRRICKRKTEHEKTYGRPRKYTQVKAPIAAADAAKRPRGRPRKTPVAVVEVSDSDDAEVLPSEQKRACPAFNIHDLAQELLSSEAKSLL